MVVHTWGVLVAQRSSGLTSHGAGPGTLAWPGVWPWEHSAGGEALAHYQTPFHPERAEKGNALQAGRPEQG